MNFNSIDVCVKGPITINTMSRRTNVNKLTIGTAYLANAKPSNYYLIFLKLYYINILEKF